VNVTSTTCLDLRLPAVPSSIRKARDAAAAAVASLRDGRLADDVRLCVSEAVTNVVRHAYGRQRGELELVVLRHDGDVTVVVRDDGKGMTKGDREGRSGGFGLKIIAKVASEHEIRTRPRSGVEMEMVFRAEEPAERAPTRRTLPTAVIA
jgi:anti-sigma regulatory factor (Ser/Thr protein kinase)